MNIPLFMIYSLYPAGVVLRDPLLRICGSGWPRALGSAQVLQIYHQPPTNMVHVRCVVPYHQPGLELKTY